MLQNALTIRHYQKLTDSLVELWNRGYRHDELRMFVDGYIAALRHASVLEPFQIHRLEEETFRYIHDPSNFEMPVPQPEVDYY